LLNNSKTKPKTKKIYKIRNYHNTEKMAKRYRKDRESTLHETGKVRGGTFKTKQSQELKKDDIRTKARPGFRKGFTPEKYKKPKSKLESQPGDTLGKLEERFDKAFAISLGLIALFSLLLLIPFIGPVMGLTLGPYLACNRGCRHVNKINGLQVGLLVGAIWSIIELYLMFQILNYVKISVSTPGIKSGIDLTIIILLFSANLIFCMLGGYTGGSKFEKLLSKKEIADSASQSI
jgi:hypothetical protein